MAIRCSYSIQPMKNQLQTKCKPGLHQSTSTQTKKTTMQRVWREELPKNTWITMHLICRTIYTCSTTCIPWKTTTRTQPVSDRSPKIEYLQANWDRNMIWMQATQIKIYSFWGTSTIKSQLKRTSLHPAHSPERNLDHRINVQIKIPSFRLRSCSNIEICS